MKNIFLSTYMQVAMSDHTLLQELLQRYSRTDKPEIKETQKPEAKNPLIQLEEIQEVFRGPYHPLFAQFFEHFALIIRMQLEFAFKDEAFSQGEYQTERKKIPEETLAAIPESLLVTARKELDTALKTQADAWAKLYLDSTQVILESLKKGSVEISSIETQELASYETVTDLLNRCRELNVVLPETLQNKTEFPMAAYLQLKMILLLESSLSRRHLPHGPEDREVFLKQLKKVFKEIEKNTETLISSNQTELEKITEPLHFLKKIDEPANTAV